MSQIHTACLGVMKDIASTGIAKALRNTQQGYQYRGIEDAMNELSPLLVKHGIDVTPTYSELSITERVKGDPADGKAMRFATIKGAFKFEAGDGSFALAECYGEAMDSGDKALIKAQSVAFRTALFQKFVVPTVAMDPESYVDPEEPQIPEELLTKARTAAMGGWKALSAFIKELPEGDRTLLEPESASLKAAAKAADKTAEGAKA